METNKALHILLIENRALEGISRRLNLEYYLGAQVEILDSFDVKKVSTENFPDIIIARPQIGEKTVAQFAEALRATANNKSLPFLVVTGNETENFTPDVFLVEPCSMKSILAICAKQFGITAQMMAEKEVPPYLPLPKGFHRALLFLPCDLYRPNSENVFNKEFKKGEFIEKQLAEKLEQFDDIHIKAMVRLQFVNSLTEQKAALEKALGDKSLEKSETMSILNASTDMIAERVRSAGLDEEAVKLASTTISNIDTLVESYPEIKDLLKDITKTKLGFRFLHAQLVTFVGFHVLKILGDWNDVFRTWWSEIAFFQNIFLESEEEYRVYSKSALAAFPADRKPVVADHAQICAQVLEGMEQLANEVVVGIRGHHGQVQGKGFVDKPEAISPLATMAYFTDRCATYLAERANGNTAIDGKAFWSEMESLANTSEAKEILTALRYLDPDHFLNDFLLPAESPLAPTMTELSKAFDLIEDLPREVRQKWERQLRECQVVVEEKHRESDGSDTTVIHNATMIIKDELIEVKDNGASDIEPEQSTVINNATMVIRDELITIKDFVEDNSEKNKIEVIKSVTEKIDTLEHVVVGKVAFRKVASAERVTASNLEEEKEDNYSAGIKKLKKVTPMMAATLQGDLEKVTRLAEDRSTLTETDEEGKLCLHYAALAGKVEIIKLFLDKGMNVNTIDVKRRPPLFFALVNKQNEAFDFLIQAGARTNQQLLGSVSLSMVAAGCGNGHAFSYLMSAPGFRSEAKDYKGKTVLDYARIGKSREVLTTLASYLKDHKAS